MNAQSALELKPRGVGELFDLAIRLYRKNFLKFVGIIALAEVPVQLLTMIISVLTFGSTIQDLSSMPYDPSGEMMTSYLARMASGAVGTMAVGILSFILIQGVASSALTRSIIDSYLGVESGIGDAYENIKGSWLPLVLTLLLLGLIIFGFLIWAIIPCIGWFSGMGFIFFFTLVITPLIAPIVVIERQSGWAAIERAWNLSRKRFWWMIGFITLLYFFNLLVVSGPVSVVNALLVQVFSNNMPDTSAAFTAQLISQSIVGLIMSLIYLPLQSICAALLYFDLRVRNEGFDLVWMAQQVSDSPISIEETVRQAPVAPNQSLITWPEFGNFVAFSFLASIVFTIPVLIIASISAMISQSF